MKILGIDTSSIFLSIALSEDRDIIIEEDHLLDRKHSSELIPKIKDMLEKAAISIDKVDAFVVGLGPGSFTGLRIGVSTVKGFSIATNKPCIGIPSIDSLALNVDNGDKLIVPIIDAKRQNLYSAIYKKEKNQIINKSGHLLLKIDELIKKIKYPAIFLGDGVGLYREKIERLNKKAVFMGEEYWYPKAGNLIRLGFNGIRRRKSMNLGNLKPIYIYPKDCQVRKKK